MLSLQRLSRLASKQLFMQMLAVHVVIAKFTNSPFNVITAVVQITNEWIPGLHKAM